jgi:hypothetical protein
MTVNPQLRDVIAQRDAYMRRALTAEEQLVKLKGNAMKHEDQTAPWFASPVQELQLPLTRREHFALRIYCVLMQTNDGIASMEAAVLKADAFLELLDKSAVKS